MTTTTRKIKVEQTHPAQGVQAVTTTTRKIKVERKGLKCVAEVWERGRIIPPGQISLPPLPFRATATGWTKQGALRNLATQVAILSS